MLLRPVEWLDDCGYAPGATVHLELPELGAEGPAEVLSIGPCPEIEPSPSPDCRLVTGTFVHSSGEIVDVRIEGLDEPIGCTANHPFWSEDRQEFVQAAELQEGETLLTANDTLTHVITVTPRQTTEPVYNLEVDLDHVYYVSTSGVLVHNGCPKLPKRKGPIPNRGRTKTPHGGEAHNKAIDKLIAKARKAGATDIRKNQAQVDYHGNKVGANRPDIQFNLKGKHHNIEFDNSMTNSINHGSVISGNDPNSFFNLILL